MLSNMFIQDMLLIVTDIAATFWLLVLFSTVRLDPPTIALLRLSWRNILLTIVAGLLLSIGARIRDWGDIFRYWRAGTSVLVFLVGLMLIMNRVFEPPDEEISWLLRYSSNFTGWLFMVMVLITWGKGFS